MATNMSRDDQLRLFSFENFPATFTNVSETELAKAGFTYSGYDDEVVCHSCNLKYRDWKDDEDPMDIHRRASPGCPFLSNKSNAYTCTRPNLTFGKQQNFKKLPESTYQMKHSESFTKLPESMYHMKPSENQSNQPPGGTNTSQLFSDSWTDNKITDRPNFVTSEEDIYSAPDASIQHRPFGSVGDQTISNNQYQSRIIEEKITLPNVQPHPCDDRTNESLNFRQSSLDHRSSDFDSIPPFTHTRINSPTVQNPRRSPSPRQIPLPEPTSQRPIILEENIDSDFHTTSIPPLSHAPGNILPQGHSLVPQPTVISQRTKPILSEEHNPRNNPYNMSDITNSLPLNHQRDNTYQPLMVTSNDEAMELANDLQQQTQGQDWYTRRGASSERSHPPPSLDYTNFEVRLNSFRGVWQSSSPVQPLELAEAGLHFTGPNDRVQCAWCRGGLYGWEPNDTAFSEHHRHFPQCWFVKEKVSSLLAGRDFIPPPDPYPEHQHETLRTQLPSVQHEEPHDQLGVNQNQVQLINQPNPQHHTSPFQHNQSEVSSQRQTTGEMVRTQLGSMQHQEMLRPTPQAQPVPQHQFMMEISHNNKSQSMIGIVQTMGFDLDLINKAMQKLNTDRPVTTDRLLDVLYDMEEAGDEDAATAMAHDEMDHILDSYTTPSQNEIEDPAKSRIKILKEENEKLRESTSCRFCTQNEVDMLFLPCRHLVSCEDCAKKRKVTQCPLCKQTISGMVKTFLP